MLKAWKASAALRWLLVLMLLGSGFVWSVTDVSALNTTYYIDSVNGNDANSGTGTGSAWRTLTKVNSTTFQAGDQILFKAGGVWTGQLWPKGSGAAGNPIVMDRYGTGNAPTISGGGTVDTTVKLENQQYWTIQNLEITNNASSRTQRSGISILATQAGTYNGIHLKNLVVHDVKGVSEWDTTPYSPFYSAAIFVKNNTPVVAAKFNDLLIENNTVYDSTGMGILVMNDISQSTNLSTVSYNTNVRVKGNYVYNTGRDGIIVGGSDAPIVEYNTARNLASIGADQRYIAGIWNWTSKNALFQYNEVGGMNWVGADSMAWDIDWGSTGTHTFQYNYSHNNDGGVFLLCCSNQVDKLVFRYNISQNDGVRSGVGARFNLEARPADIYNNTVYTTGKIVMHTHGFPLNGSKKLYNNIFVGNSDSIYDNNFTYDRNLYFGHPGPSSDVNKSNRDPMLANPGSGGDGRNTVDGYKLLTGSPALGAGTLIAGNGGLDYWGNAVSSTGSPNIGAYNGSGVSGYGGPVTNNTASGFAYTGAWSVSSNRPNGDYFNDVHYTTANNAYFTYTFNGTGIDYISERADDMGTVDIYIDNVYQTTVDAYSATTQTARTLYSIRGLSSGSHTLKAIKTGGTFMLVDGVRIYTGAYINDDFGGIAYTGSWGDSNNRNAGDYEDDVHYASANGSYFTYTFNGTGIEYITEKANDMGEVDIYLDNVYQGRFNCYNGATLYQQTLFSKRGLSSGSHTLKIIKVSGTNMLLDAFVVY
jgi:parallel beta-helix repeat protein